MSKRVAIGIDLGTTNSCVGVMRNGMVYILANEMGERRTPSIVSFDDYEIKVGEAAKADVEFNPRNTVFEAKRLIGRTFADASVLEDIEQWPFEVFDDNGSPKIRVDYRRKRQVFAPEQISSIVLKKMKTIAENDIQEEIHDAVITVPAHFNDSQRQATIEAGNIAGLNVLRLINKPTAAALAYRYYGNYLRDQTVMIFDFGNRRFDVSIISIEKNEFLLKAKRGDTHVGGAEIDLRLVNHFLKIVKLKYEKDLSTHPRHFWRLSKQCKRVKEELSIPFRLRATVFVPGIISGKNFKETLSRNKFEMLCLDLFKKTIEHVASALTDAGLNKSDIDEVILVGGSTRIPKIQGLLREFFNGKKLMTTINPDEVVVYGATVLAALPSSHSTTVSERVAIGIDLGTTNSCVGIFRDRKLEILENFLGSRTTPSRVAFEGTVIHVGEAAKAQAAKNPQNTVFEAKRLIGRRFADASVQEDIKQWPFEVFDDNGTPKIRVDYNGDRKVFTPEQISSMVLKRMKDFAERTTDGEVQDAVITVPAYFNHSQRQATIEAGKIAGLNVLSIINEPTAAALAYGHARKPLRDQTVMIFDFGGGTFDVSIITIAKKDIKVRAHGGDTHLGGADFDIRLVNHFIKIAKQKHKQDFSSNPKHVWRLREACEEAKKMLSTPTGYSTNVVLLGIIGGEDFQETLSRTTFEQLCLDLFEKTIEYVARVLADAGMNKSDIDQVILVGGSSRIPKIQELLRKFFDGKKLTATINPDEAVAYGAALKAALVSEEHTIQKITLQDVVPLSLGLKNVKDNTMQVFIKRNSPIPITRNKKLSVSSVSGTSVVLDILEGERISAFDNNLLGTLTFDVGERKLAGVQELSLTFEVDVNGILHVSVANEDNQRSERLTVSSKSQRLSSRR